MKILIFAAVILLTSCYSPPQYQYMQGPGGQQMVRVYDGGMEYMVEAAMFNSLGYSGCVNYYHVHPTLRVRYNSSNYGGWSNVKTPNPAISAPRNSGFRRTNTPTPTYRVTSPPPARSSGFQRSRSPTPSYRTTSPSRSSSFRRR